MTSEKFYEVIGDIDEKYVEGAKRPVKVKKRFPYKALGAIAACLCLAAIGTAIPWSGINNESETMEAADHDIIRDGRYEGSLKPVINFEGTVVAVEGNKITLDNGEVIIISDNTKWMGDPDTYDSVSTDVEVGNFIQGFTEDDINSAEISADNIWTNRAPSETTLIAKTQEPQPEMVQAANPMLEVSSVEEMEQYLDFEVPTLDKAAEAYIVMIIDKYPRIARIEYEDNSTFNMEYGTGDISGIYGGTLDKEETINNVKVNFYTYFNDTNTIRYALWEKDGFTYSLTGTDTLEEDVHFLTR